MNAAAPRVGLRPERLARLIGRTVDRMEIDLSGAHVLTEAATGAYAVTPVIAALAGAASVTAVTRPTRYGDVSDVISGTMAVAHVVGVADRIAIHEGRPSAAVVALADVITNSGHVRPIDATVVGWMKPSAVVPLMFESWEIDLGRDDVDLDALRARGVRFAGTNERHPEVGVFSFLGPMAVKLLADSAVSAFGARVLVVCDNPFSPYLRDGLVSAGAAVVVRSSLDRADLDEELDVILVALKPGGVPAISRAEIRAISELAPGAIVAQFWGDIPRPWCEEYGVACTPHEDPGVGHMGVLPSAVGPEPIVRLQAGGLKVAQLLRRQPSEWSEADRSYVDEI